MFSDLFETQIGIGVGLLITLLSAFVVAALVFLMLAALNLLRSRERFSRTGYQLALEVLNERLISGEIDRSQYQQLREQLEGG